MSSRRFLRGGVVSMLAASLVACGTPTPLTTSVPQPTSESHKVLGYARAVNGIVEHLNDAPRNAHSRNFAARQAAAHSRGVWLTDELTAPHVTRPVDPNALRRTSSTPILCDGCDAGGGTNGGAASGVFSYFDDHGGNYPYDTELDMPDGSSILYEEFTNGVGDVYLTTLLPDMSYTLAYTFYGGASKSCGLPSGPLFIGINVCRLPKMPTCPIVAVAIGTAIGAIKSRIPWAQAAGGGFIGESFAVICNGLLSRRGRAARPEAQYGTGQIACRRRKQQTA